MNIQGQSVSSQQQSGGDRPLSLQRGEVYQAKVVERTSNSEAVLSIRGQIVHASFEGKVPKENQATVEVTGRQDDRIQVKTVTENKISARSAQESGSGSVDRVLGKLGVKDPSNELRTAAQRFLDQGAPLTRANVQDLKHYIERGPGQLNDRLETANFLAQKQLPPSQQHLNSAHEALHSRGLYQQIQQLANHSSEIAVSRHARNFNEVSQALRSEIAAGRLQPETIQAFKRVLLNESNTSEQMREINRMLQTIQQQMGEGRTQQAMETLSQLLTKVTPKAEQTLIHNNPPVSVAEQWQNILANQPHLPEALNLIREQMLNASLTEEQRTNLDIRLTEASSRQGEGRELKARQIVVSVLEDLSRQMNVSRESAPLTQTGNVEVARYIDNEQFQRLPVRSKDFLMTALSEKVANSTAEFNTMQRNVSQQLDRIQQVMQHFRMQATSQARPMLDTVIRQLDQALLKNDWMLFTDMKTERRMLEASSQLAEAKKLLGNGQHQEARQLVRSVQQTIDQLQFKPSEKKIQHFVSREGQWQETRTVNQRLSHHLQETARSFIQNEGSPRQIFEGVRSIGITREADLAQILAGNKGNVNEANQRNMKGLLIQLMRGEEDGARQQQAQQALMNVTGQQLLSKNDHHQPNLQTLLFQLPILLKDQTVNLQVFVNSRNKGEQLDWENCSLYFLLETKKLGEVGIALQVTDRNLTITLKNDKPDFQRNIEPFAKACVHRLKDVGYNVRGLHFKAMNEGNERVNHRRGEKATTSTMTEKGFDFKV